MRPADVLALLFVNIFPENTIEQAVEHDLSIEEADAKAHEWANYVEQWHKED